MEEVVTKEINMSQRQIKMQSGNTTSMIKLCKRDTKIKIKTKGKIKIKITLNIKKEILTKITSIKTRKETEIKIKCKT